MFISRLLLQPFQLQLQPHGRASKAFFFHHTSLERSYYSLQPHPLLPPDTAPTSHPLQLVEMLPIADILRSR